MTVGVTHPPYIEVVMINLTNRQTRRHRRCAAHAAVEPTQVESTQAQPLTELIATVTHEMRSPLTALMMTADLLAEGPDKMSPEMAQSMIARIQRGVRQLTGLVDNLATTAQAGEIKLATAVMDLRECVEEAITLAQPLLEQRKQRVRLTSTARPAIVEADPVRIRQVVLNLLVNANKYSVEGDVVDVNVAITHDHAVVSVTDHGPGIDPDDCARIFEPYVRGAAHQGKARGLGLGLSIVKTLVELHGGQIGVESTPGAGATFLVEIPLWSE
jgi:signal transduction histidine kinase